MSDHNNTSCTQFEQCERIAAVLSRNSREATDLLARCLDKLYAADCRRWLTEQYGYQPVGQDTEHYAVQAFGDAVQVLFRRIGEGLFQHDKKPNGCRRFIYAVSRTTFLKLQHTGWKKTQREMPREQLPEMTSGNFEFPLEKAEKIRNLHEAINKLPEDCRAILTMRYVDDLTIDEIAQKTAQNNQQVSKRLFTAREKLKKIYNHD